MLYNKLQNNPIAATATTNQILTWNGTYTKFSGSLRIGVLTIYTNGLILLLIFLLLQVYDDG